MDTIHLNFVLNEDVTRVESTLRLKPNYTGERPDLFLHGVAGPGGAQWAEAEVCG